MKTLKEGRKTGRTTRLANEAVETFFESGEVMVSDHHNSRSSHWDLAGKVIKRLQNEHGESIDWSPTIEGVLIVRK